MTTDGLWAIDPPQEICFAGWEWDNVLIYASGPGDTHRLSHLAALTLQILVDGPRSEHDLLTELEPHWPEDEGVEMGSALSEALKGLRRIGLVRFRTP